MNNHRSQIHLLCRSKDGTDAEMILSTALKNRLLTVEDTAVYFPNGEPNDYKNIKLFVNVSFISPITIPDGDELWDPVIRSGHRHGELKTVDASDNLKQWGMKQLQSSWDKAMQLLEYNHPSRAK